MKLQLGEVSKPPAAVAAKDEQPSTRLTDEQFIEKYKKWLESAHGNFAVRKTVRDYTRYGNSGYGV